MKIFEHNNQPLIYSNVPDVVTSLLLILTISVTSANSKKSFSKMKIIKNYLRSTQQQDRPSELAILSIEAKEAEQMNIKELIRQFADLKASKKPFTS